MAVTFESAFETTLGQSLKSSGSDTTILLAAVPITVTTGVLRIGSGNNVEWVSFTGITTLTATGVTRGLDKDATSITDATSSNKKNFAVGTPVKLVAHSLDLNLKANLDTDNAHTAGLTSYTSTTVAQLQHQSVTTVERDALTGVVDGVPIYNETTGQTEWREGGAWVANTGGSVPNASATVAGKVEIGTSAQTIAGTDTGETGAKLTALPSDIAANDQSSTFKYATAVSSYTPAFLTGDTGAQSTAGTWAAVSDGSFKITIDGSAYNVDAIDFTGDASMADVAATIQAALRVVTSSTETVTWSTNHFIITSADTASTSAMTVTETSTGTVGTDISGAGGSDWMDADTGNGVVTAKVHASYNVTLVPAITAYAAGQEFGFLTDVANATAVNVNFSALAEKNLLKFSDQELEATDVEAAQIIKCKYDGTSMQMISPLASEPSTAGTVAVYGGASSNADTHHTHTLLATSNSAKSGNDAGTNASTITFAHGLGVIPKWVRLKLQMTQVLSAQGEPHSDGTYDGTSYVCKFLYKNGNPGSAWADSTAVIGQISYETSGNSSQGSKVTVTTLDATNVILTNTVSSGSARPYEYFIEVYA